MVLVVLDLFGQKNLSSFGIFCICMIVATNLERMSSTKPSEEVQVIRKADLENHNKDGGLWVVIHGKVYDIQDFKSQAPCGSDQLLKYAGQSSENCRDPSIIGLVQNDFMSFLSIFCSERCIRRL